MDLSRSAMYVVIGLYLFNRGPKTSGNIRDALYKAGYTYQKNAINTRLREMIKEGVLERTPAEENNLLTYLYRLSPDSAETFRKLKEVIG